MKVWKTRFLLVAALALVLQAQAKPVSADAARRTAQAWAMRGEALGARFGASVERAAALAVATNATVYAVKMSGGGTVFVAGDDAYEPIVAFTAATNDYSTIDKKSPLWALLQRDAEVRAKLAAAGVTNKTATSAKKTTVTPLTTTHLSYEPSDLRVAPLVQSKWDQTTVGGKLCYNRDTPVLKTGSHATCGCVATAMSQIMRYHKFPTASRESVTRTCYLDIYLVTKEDGPDYVGFITNLTTQAGVYDWASMPLVPASDVTDEQCAAIGKLTSDAGISVNMAYGTDSYGSSGAYVLNVPKGLKEAFGYANADYCMASEVSASTTAMRQGFLANLDASYPVLMNITGAGGHAIVGDGYGYEGETLYVHLNMGWSGQCDTWYNLPDVDTDYYHFTVFDGMVCNVFPEEAEKNTLLTGRVTDAEGTPVAGAAVRVYATGTTTLVAEGVTSATGVYGVRLPAGTYDVEFEKTGYPAETLTSVAVAATKSVSIDDLSRPIVSFSDGTSWLETLSFSMVWSFGNSHGNDVVISDPCAQIVVGVETNLYATLDKAIAGGASLVAEGAAEPIVIELLKDIPLKTTATIDYACELTTAKGVADAVSVTRTAGAALAVAGGGSLDLHDVAFASGSSTVVTVAAGGTLSLGSGVDFGVPSTIAAVKTADAAGFVLAGELAEGFTLDCAAARLVKGVFGSTTLDADAAATSAARIANFYDAYGEQRGVAEARALSWANVPVPLTDAAAYFTDKDGNTVAAARLDRALETYEDYRVQGLLGDSPAIVVRDCLGLSLSRRTTVANDLVLRGEKAGVTIGDIASGAGFVVGAGGSLAVKNLTFDGSARSDGSALKLDTLFLVKGGALAVKDVTFENLASTNGYSPAVAILSGSATVSSSTFANCRANGTRSQTYGGGGIFVNSGASLALSDTAITDCYAATYGGGVYAFSGASVTLSGKMTVTDNVSGNLSSADNLHLLAGATKEASLTLAGAVTGAVGVRWRGNGVVTTRASADGVFATAASADVATASADVFANDADASLEGAADGANLVWAVSSAASREVPEEDAVASVTSAGGGETRYYASLADAVAMLAEDATVTMLKDDEISEEILITNAVTLCSADGSATITRDESLVISFDTSSSTDVTPCITVASGGSLVVRDLTLDGSDCAGTMLKSTGGALTLASGATVTGVASGSRVNASAVYVTSGGTFTMESGARVESCANDYSNDALFEYAIGGGVRVSRATAYLKGGTVTSCSSVTGGGVAITDRSTAYVSGDFNVVDNTGGGGTTRDNLLVSNNSTLCLAGELTAEVGVSAGVSANTNVFGCVTAKTSSSLLTTTLVSSARKFTNDKTGDTGVAVKPVTGSGDTLLVWKGALDADGGIEIDGVDYAAVEGSDIDPEPEPEPTVVTPTPIAFQSITKVSEADGTTTWQLVVTNRVPWCHYRLIFTDDLAKGFTTTGAWEQVGKDATPVWTTNVTTTTDAAFWQAEGKEGEVGE